MNSERGIYLQALGLALSCEYKSVPLKWHEYYTLSCSRLVFIQEGAMAPEYIAAVRHRSTLFVIHTRAHAHTHTHARMHAHTRTHTHTHTWREEFTYIHTYIIYTIMINPIEFSWLHLNNCDIKNDTESSVFKVLVQMNIKSSVTI